MLIITYNSNIIKKPSLTSLKFSPNFPQPCLTYSGIIVKITPMSSPRTNSTVSTSTLNPKATSPLSNYGVSRNLCTTTTKSMNLQTSVKIST